MEKITEEDSVAAYAEATDGCRPLVRATRDSARQEQRVIDADLAVQRAEQREARRESNRKAGAAVLEAVGLIIRPRSRYPLHRRRWTSVFCCDWAWTRKRKNNGNLQLRRSNGQRA
jgi:hypothetical protein